MPTSTPSRPRRWASYAATAALVAGAATVLGTGPARAADAGDETLTWRISQYLDEHLTGQTFSRGATEDAATGKVTFSGGTAARSADGTRTLSYQGTARYAFANPGTGAEIYSLTVSDPAVVVDGTGAARVLADVAWSVPSQGVAGSVTDTLLTTVAPAAASWSGTVLSATPRWAGVAAADAYGAGKPVDGQSWDPGFVTALPSSLNPFFYASGSANDAKKSPGSFVAVEAPSVRVSTTSSTPAGLVLGVAGTAFNPTTNPGDAGVYVGLAPAGGLPDVSSQAGMDAFAASAWVTPAQFSAGAFTTSLTAAAARLDPTRSWSVYTWQAHGRSNATQDTETPVSIDWASLVAPTTTPPTPGTTAPAAPVPTTVALRWVRKATAARAGRLRVTLGSSAQRPTGTVEVVLRKQDRKVARTAALSGGTATIAVPRLARGTWKVVVTYAGQGASAPVRTTAKVRVR